MATHTRLSASAAHRWLVCAGSVRLSEGIPNKTSEHAALGTYAHSLAAERRYSIHSSAVIDGHKVVCDQEMVDGISCYLDVLDADKKKGDQTWVEQPLTPALSKLDPDLGGTADYVRWRPKTKQLRVFDFKYGAGHFVVAKDNKQLMVYALGALLALNKPADEVIVTIVQPRIEHAEGRVRDWSFPAKDLLEFAGDLIVAANLSRQPDAPLVPGSSQCQWCPAARVCPETEKAQHALVAAEFSELTTYDPVALGAALDSIPLAEARIKALREFAYQEAEAGRSPPGWKLVAKRGTRKWISEDDVVAWAQERAIEVYDAPSLKSPAQLEKGLSAAEKKDLSAMTVTVSSGNTLVPESDKRPAVHSALAGEFEVISSQ